MKSAKLIVALVISLFLITEIQAGTQIEYVTKANHTFLINNGFIEIEPGTYRTTYKEYDAQGNFIRVSYIYVIEKKFFV